MTAVPTNLRCNLAFLQRLVTEAIRLHTPKSVEEATMLADIRDYIMYLCLDGCADSSLAENLVKSFSALQAWLEHKHDETPVWRDEREITCWYIGFLFALEQLLSLKHEMAVMPGEAISREAFMRSWKRTAEKLRL